MCWTLNPLRPTSGRSSEKSALVQGSCFFGTLKDGPGQGHWVAKPYGIDESTAGAELAESGPGDLRDDPSLVLMTYRKGDLQL